METSPPDAHHFRLKFLTREQVLRIDALLGELGEYGEVHLIVQNGELRFVNTIQSYKAWDETKKKKK